MHKNARKQNKFQLTPEAYKMLMRISNELGKFQRRGKNGELLYRTQTDYQSTETKGNKKITHFNKGKEAILVNHAVNLIQIYQKEGKTGVDAYVKFFKELGESENKPKD